MDMEEHTLIERIYAAATEPDRWQDFAEDLSKALAGAHLGFGLNHPTDPLAGTAYLVGITPEGTRKKLDRWKTGFHHIGRAADVPIVLVALDFGRKTIGPIATIDLTDDLNHDLTVIAGHFEGIRGRNPELFTPPV